MLHSHDKKDSHHGHDEKKPSNKELISSAKLVADAAKSAMNKDNESIDKGKVAAAAADLLGAASHHGKFQEGGGMGKYLNQAEEYLDKFAEKEAAKSKDPDKHKFTDSDDHSTKHHDEEDKKHKKSEHKNKKDDGHKKSEHKNKKDDRDDEDDEKSAGFGDYLKMGKDLLGK